MLKKAMIMAAGVGSRLEPLSTNVPKPLVPIANCPVMDILINHLISFGIKDVIANTFYKSENIVSRYKNSQFDINFNYIKEEKLSGTAGGVKKCQFFFNKNEDFIVLSGDGLTDLDIEKAYQSHLSSGAIATVITTEIALSEVQKYGIIVTNKDGCIESFQEKPKPKEAKSNLANTGIYIFNYKIFDYIPENTFYDFAKNVFPSLAENKIKINTYNHKGYWSDIGSLNQYVQSNIDIINSKLKNYTPKVIKDRKTSYIAGRNCDIKSELIGNCIIGNNCTTGVNSIIKNSILWDNVEVKDNVTIENSIVISNSVINESIFNQIADNKSNIIKEKVTA